MKAQLQNPKSGIRGPKKTRKPNPDAERKAAAGNSSFGVWHSVFGFLALLLLSAVPSSRAQSYSIDWFTIDGGGSTSTGGVYSVSGTIGQPDAGGPMTNGQYYVTGGFWSIVAAMQTTGTPLLSITLTATNSVVVSWPSPSTGFALQQNTDLNMTNWVGPSETLNDNGTSKFIIVNPPAGNRFYRLLKP